MTNTTDLHKEHDTSLTLWGKKDALQNWAKSKRNIYLLGVLVEKLSCHILQSRSLLYNKLSGVKERSK